MKKLSIALIIMSTLVSKSYAQSIEDIVKEKATQVCNCLETFDYIDSKLDLMMKVKDCTQLSKADSIKITEISNIDTFNLMLYELLFNCGVISAKIEEWEGGYMSIDSDALDANEKVKNEFDESLIGEYSSKPGSGGLTIYLDYDHRFMMGAYDFIKSGTWEVINKKYLHLIPDKPKYPFVIYGRKNPDIGDSTKTVFINASYMFQNLLINYGFSDNKQSDFCPVFNSDGNCFPNKPIVMLKGKVKELSLAPYFDKDKKLISEIDIFTIANTKGFNEFIVEEYLEGWSSSEVRGVVVDNKLMLSEMDSYSKRPFSDEYIKNKDELAKMCNSYRGLKITPWMCCSADYEYYSEERLKSEHYHLNRDMGAYLSIRKYEDGRVDTLKLNNYELLKEISIEKKQCSISEKALIIGYCNNGY